MNKIRDLMNKTSWGWIVALGMVPMLLAGCQPEHSGPKPAPAASFAQGSQYRLDIVVDPDTGCQYLQQDYKGITPRIAADGKTHMGCKGA